MKYFKLSEFNSPDEPGSGKEMKKHFLNRLDRARDIAGIPFKINSGYRTPTHNLDVGGKVDSSHTIGEAADIEAIGSRNRFIITQALIQAGFNRIGIGKNFIHVDCDSNKDKNVIWLY